MYLQENIQERSYRKSYIIVARRVNLVAVFAVLSQKFGEGGSTYEWYFVSLVVGTLKNLAHAPRSLKLLRCLHSN